MDLVNIIRKLIAFIFISTIVLIVGWSVYVVIGTIFSFLNYGLFELILGWVLFIGIVGIMGLIAASNSN
jgi:hypothetical protein